MKKFKLEISKSVWKIIYIVSAVICGASALILLIMVGIRVYDIVSLHNQGNRLSDMKNNEDTIIVTEEGEIERIEAEEKEPQKVEGIFILEEYVDLYNENPDIIGWLTIPDTNIDYPVMQTTDDPNYYLSYDFFGKRNQNGSLILDGDSEAGIGIADNRYSGGIKPSANLIIHGHTMRTGDMFGKLDAYAEASFGAAHSKIYFDSLYEKRTYELISVFYSEVYEKTDDVFKYYDFFEADTQEEFDVWYQNIKQLSLYDTHVEAVYGDEFITLSACSYHEDEGRFVVVAKRIYE